MVDSKQIKTAPLPKLFDTLNVDGTRSGNHKVTQFVLLELENIDMVVIGLNGTDIFLEYDWLIKHILEVIGTKRQYGLQDVQINTRYSTRIFCLNIRLKELHQQKKQIKNTGKIEKKLNSTNTKDLPSTFDLLLIYSTRKNLRSY